MPLPINALRTRVILCDNGQYMVQLSADNLSWNNAALETIPNEHEAVMKALNIGAAAGLVPSAGKQVWPKK